MQTSDIGRNVLIAREALKTVAYRDSVGVWTVGVGHTSAAGEPKVTPGLKITVAQALDIFKRDLAKYEAAVNNAVKVSLGQNEFDALVSFCYNVGPGAFAKSTVVKRLNAGRKGSEIADALMMWVKPIEITSRRRGEADQFLTPYTVAMPKARSTDRGRVSDKRRHVAQNDVPQPASDATMPVGSPDPGAQPVLASRADPSLVAPAGPFSGLLRLFQGKPPVPKGTGKAVVAETKAEVPSLMKDLGDVRILGLLGAGGSVLGGVQDSGLLDTVKSTADSATSTFESVQSLINLVLGAIKWGVTHWWVFGLVFSLYVLVRIGWAIFKVYVYVRNNLKPQ